MKVVVEFDLPEGQAIPDPRDIVRLTSPDWISDWWHTDDIRDEHDWLTEEQARECLELISKYHDANIGINWDFIREIVRANFDKPEGYCFIATALNDSDMKYGIQVCSDREGKIVDDVEWFDTEEDFKTAIQDFKDNTFVFPEEELV
jgi:hypothetical protein